LRGRLCGGDRAGGRALRRARPDQPRLGRRDRHPRPGRARGRAHGLRRRDRLGHVEAERPATAAARHVEGRGPFRPSREHAAAGRPRANHRVVPGARTQHEQGMKLERAWRVIAAAWNRIPLSEPWRVLAALLAFHWIALVVYTTKVNHNAWLFYQGGDQI